MNRSAKWLVLVLAMTVCLTALWGCGEKVDDPQLDNTAGTTIQLNRPDLPPESSDGMEFCDGSVTLRLILNEKDQWVWKDDRSFPLDQACAQEMLVMDLPGVLLDFFLQGMHQAGIHVPLKAALTPTNVSWTASALQQELQRERQEFLRRGIK